MTLRTELLLFPLLLLLCGLQTSCTKNRFMDRLSNKAAPSAEEMELTSLSAEQMIAQLQGFDLQLTADTTTEAPKPFLLCDQEKPQVNEVARNDDLLRVRYEAEANACPGVWFKDEPGQLSHGTGFGSYLFELSCPAKDLDSKLLKPAGFFVHQSFDVAGKAETACLGAAGGKAGYRIETRKSHGMDVTDRLDTSRTATFQQSESYTAIGKDGVPCTIQKRAEGGVVIESCIYTLRFERRETFSFKGPERIAVLTKAEATSLVAIPGERFYAGGSMELSVNDWKGRVVFKDGKTPPEAELSNGQKVIRVRMNGAFTEALP